MTKWDHIIIEGMCMFGSMKDKKMISYSYKNTKDIFSKKKGKKNIRDNPLYCSKNRPKWCQKKFKGSRERVPEFRCLCSNNNGSKCPFFVFSECLKEDIELFELCYYVKGELCFNEDWELDKKKLKKLMAQIYMIKENENTSKKKT